MECSCIPSCVSAAIARFVCFFNSAKNPGGTQGHFGIPKTKSRPKRCAQSRKAGDRKVEWGDKGSGGEEKNREVRREAAGIARAVMTPLAHNKAGRNLWPTGRHADLSTGLSGKPAGTLSSRSPCLAKHAHLSIGLSGQPADTLSIGLAGQRTGRLSSRSACLANQPARSSSLSAKLGWEVPGFFLDENAHVTGRGAHGGSQLNTHALSARPPTLLHSSTQSVYNLLSQRAREARQTAPANACRTVSEGTSQADHEDP